MMGGGNRDPSEVSVAAEGVDTSVLVVSCDKYRDLWVPFFTLFFKYWPDCPYQVYLCANEMCYEDERVQTILTGPDKSWSSNLMRCFEKLTKDYVILFQEDFLFTKPVDTERIRDLALYLKDRHAACLRLMPCPPPETIVDYKLKVGEISKGAPYRVSLQSAIWNKSVLYELLKDGESPWDLENIGSIRSNALDKPFLSVAGQNRTAWPLDYFSTAVVQGKWVREAVDICRREAIPVDKTQRPIESRLSPLQRKVMANLRRIKRRLFPPASLISPSE
jgi:hypothetical protein